MESDIADRLRRYFVTQRNQWNVADEIERLRNERDEARRLYCELVADLDCEMKEDIARANEWDDLYSIDNTPSLFEQNEVRRTRRSDFTEQQSDSDPRTGVQYGDLN